MLFYCVFDSTNSTVDKYLSDKKNPEWHFKSLIHFPECGYGVRQPGLTPDTIYTTGCLENIPSEEFEACFTQALPYDMTLKEFPCYFDYNFPQFASLSDCTQNDNESNKASLTMLKGRTVIVTAFLFFLYCVYLWYLGMFS